MAKKPGSRPKTEFVFSDVTYETDRNGPIAVCQLNCWAARRKTNLRSASLWSRIETLLENPDAPRFP